LKVEKSQDSKFNPIYLELAKEYPEVLPEAIETAVQFKIISAQMQTDREEMFSHLGLTSGRFHLLMILKVEPTHCLSPSELAKKSQVTRATMTQFIDALEKENLVIRMDDPKDRRGMLVELTDKGISKVNEIMPHYLNGLTNFTKVLTKEEREQFHFLMQKIQPCSFTEN
jgi:DNA-binding MarR family transcriptional regulator